MYVGLNERETIGLVNYQISNTEHTYSKSTYCECIYVCKYDTSKHKHEHNWDSYGMKPNIMCVGLNERGVDLVNYQIRYTTHQVMGCVDVLCM